MISQERFREVAYTSVQMAAGSGAILSTGEAVKCAADALHAAYEAELEALESKIASLQHELSLPAPEPSVGWRFSDSARLSSVKETARAIWAAYFVSGDTPMSQWYSGGKDVERIKADTNAVVNLADELESAFERRYGGKP